MSGVSLSYQCRVVPRPEVNGSCLVLEKHGAHETEFGSVMQRCLARRLAGRTVRFESLVPTGRATPPDFHVPSAFATFRFVEIL